jgi:hypothetical protein
MAQADLFRLGHKQVFGRRQTLNRCVKQCCCLSAAPPSPLKERAGLVDQLGRQFNLGRAILQHSSDQLVPQHAVSPDSQQGNEICKHPRFWSLSYAKKSCCAVAAHPVIAGKRPG